MICVTVEIREGTVTRRARLTTSSIERALELAGEGKPQLKLGTNDSQTDQPSKRRPSHEAAQADPD